MSNSLIFFKPLKLEMLENIAYLSLGFVTVFLALEASVALYGLQDTRQIHKAMHVQASKNGISTNLTDTGI